MSYDDAPEWDVMDEADFMEDMPPEDEFESMMAAQYEDSEVVKKKSNDGGGAEGGRVNNSLNATMEPAASAAGFLPPTNNPNNPTPMSTVPTTIVPAAPAAITMASSDLSTASSSFTAYPGSIKGQYRTMNSLVTPGSSAARAREEEKKLKKAQEMIKRIREGKGGGK